MAPASPVTVTRAPGSPVPATDAPSAATVAVGAAGAVTSSATSAVERETLPAASACVTDSVWPSSCGVASVATKPPAGVTVAVARIVPSAARTEMVAPGSPVPVTMVPVASSVASGAAGAVRSGAVAVAGGETSPSAAVCVTRTISASISGGESATA